MVQNWDVPHADPLAAHSDASLFPVPLLCARMLRGQRTPLVGILTAASWDNRCRQFCLLLAQGSLLGSGWRRGCRCRSPSPVCRHALPSGVSPKLPLFKGKSKTGRSRSNPFCIAPLSLIPGACPLLSSSPSPNHSSPLPCTGISLLPFSTTKDLRGVASIRR